MDLREFRKVNGLTQGQLGEFLGMLTSFISKVENGREKLPEKKFQKILENDRGWDISMLQEVEHPTANQGVIIRGDNVQSPIHQDNRQSYSDSPEVLRARIDLLEERIKEKDAQIKEKDAQINKLLNILESR